MTDLTPAQKRKASAYAEMEAKLLAHRDGKATKDELLEAQEAYWNAATLAEFEEYTGTPD